MCVNYTSVVRYFLVSTDVMWADDKTKVMLRAQQTPSGRQVTRSSEYNFYTNETRDKTTILDKYKCRVALEGQAPPYSTTVSLLVIILGVDIS